MGQDMPLQVIDLHQRSVLGDGEPFGERHADQQRSEQSRAACDGDAVHLVGSHARLFQREIHHRDDILSVGAGGEFGNDAAVFGVDGLRGDDVRQQRPVAYDGGGGVVARGFYAEDSDFHAGWSMK